MGISTRQIVGSSCVATFRPTPKNRSDILFHSSNPKSPPRNTWAPHQSAITMAKTVRGAPGFQSRKRAEDIVCALPLWISISGKCVREKLCTGQMLCKGTLATRTESLRYGTRRTTTTRDQRSPIHPEGPSHTRRERGPGGEGHGASGRPPTPPTPGPHTIQPETDRTPLATTSLPPRAST